MQRSLRKQAPGTIISSTSSPYSTVANQILAQSSLLLQAVGAPPCMAASQDWSSREERRRHPFHQHTQTQTRQPTASQRSSPTISPLSPTYVLRSPPTEHVRRRDSGSDFNTLRYRQADADFSPVTQQTYIPYTPNYPTEPAARSAPSLVTSFLPERPRSSLLPTTVWSAASPARFNQYHSYSNPVTLFSPVGSNPYDSWQDSPGRSRSQTYMASPASYNGPRWTDPLPEFYQQEGRGYSASSAPGALQSPVSANRAGPRRESEAADGFTSPSEFALFAEATSSLNIDASPYLPWSRASRPSPSQSRLAAPLPPLPRSHSSPASSNRFPVRQPSRTQLLAEAMVGLEREDSAPGSQSSDDELPDYAQSQAEAHARQRREAARRAQELEQSWSNARRRRG
jgi:hypothetical protein